MSNIKLSIIIPCYNVESYLPKTLHSLSCLKKTDDCEFIFVNDGSKDSTLNIIQDFVKQNSSAILINQPNQGVSVSRNNALQKVRGEYILCLDGDDYLDNNTIEIINNNIQNSDLLISPCIKDYSNRQEIFNLNIPNGEYSVEQLYTLCKVFPLAPKLVYRTSIIKNNNLLFNPQIKCGEVYDFTVSFLKYATNIKVINQAFYYYVMRENSATQKPNYKADLSVLKVLDNFSCLQNNWKFSQSFLLTAFKLVTNFTYNKYVRNNLSDKETLDVIIQVLNNNHFRKILSLLSVKSMNLKDKLYVSYFKYMPIKLGYLLCVYLQKILKF